MRAHHGPPCGHTLLGTCPVCGGHPIEARVTAAEQTFAMTNTTRTYGPVTVTAEAMAEAQRKFEELRRMREENNERLTRWLMQPSVFVEPLKVKYQPEAAGHIEARMRYMAIGPTIKGTFYIPPDPVDPLDVEYDGVKLRQLLSHDEMWRKEGWPDAWTRRGHNKLTPAQRAAVSAHWSAQLRAKVAASAAADKARAPSVVVDLEDW